MSSMAWMLRPITCSAIPHPLPPSMLVWHCNPNKRWVHPLNKRFFHMLADVSAANSHFQWDLLYATVRDMGAGANLDEVQIQRVFWPFPCPLHVLLQVCAQELKDLRMCPFVSSPACIKC